jgi:hypothetical protein
MLKKILNLGTAVLFGALFFLIVTPIGFALRLLGIDYLDRSPRPTESYWTRRT